MLQILRARLALENRTAPLPKADQCPVPEGFRGLPSLSSAPCPVGCALCAESCPTGAVGQKEGAVSLDMGKCLFCPECSRICPQGTIKLTNDHRLASTERRALVLKPDVVRPKVAPLAGHLKKLYKRSLKLRQVSAGGCNGCEAELIVTGTPVFDLSRFGVQFVASPRHADALVVTGPVSKNMRSALLKTYEALPPPRLVVACGACAIGGGPFAGSTEVEGGVGGILPVDLWIPGCPPHPWTVVDAVLRLLGRLEGTDA